MFHLQICTAAHLRHRLDNALKPNCFAVTQRGTKVPSISYKWVVSRLFPEAFRVPLTTAWPWVPLQRAAFHENQIVVKEVCT
jgi:hypothetical protein